ncbi:MAG: endonuclease/exonuclease/phosphatase family protein [Flavobacteriia bacterium]|nr:endonuclease/exonuclease/phosphatase family protein [Flavobacteriia bacterium]
MKTILLLAVGLFLTISIDAQEKRSILFYNVENLFDTINDPNINDEEFLPESKNNWNTSKYNEKLNHINQVIEEVENPLIIGLCEIENTQVIRDIINKSSKLKGKYGIVHYDSPDERGIDVGLMYDSITLKVIESGYLRYSLPDTAYSKTRDILWVKFKKGKTSFYALVNHWPSRRSGEKESEINRVIAATAAKTFIDSILTKDKNAKIVFMGDLNDHPQDKAPQMIYSILTQMIYKTSGEFGGTHNFKNEWDVLDHIAVSSGFLNPKKGIKIVPNSGKILSPAFLITTYKGEKVPFRTYAKNYLGGYSDHLPVKIEVVF